MEKNHFEEIEVLFSNLMENVVEEFTPSECIEVQEYIDAGEYGIALSTCVGIYDEEQKIASADVINLLTSLSIKMSKDPDVVLSKIKRSRGQTP